MATIISIDNGRTVNGTDEADLIYVDAVSGNLVYARDGDDQIFGGAGSNTISGDSGNDTIDLVYGGGYGGDGDDVLIARGHRVDVSGAVFGSNLGGNAGTDRFVLTKDALNTWIADFESAEIIDLSDLPNTSPLSLTSGAAPYGIWTENSLPYGENGTTVMINYDGTGDINFVFYLQDYTAPLTESNFVFNAPPVADDVTVSGSEDAVSIAGSVSATDANGDSLSYSVSGSTPEGLVFNADGTFSYTPQASDQTLKANESRDVTFQYIASDGYLNSAVQTATITINGANDAPTVGTLFCKVSEDSAEIAITGSLADVSQDIDGDVLTYRLADPTAAGTQQIRLNANGSFSFSVDPSYQILQFGQSAHLLIGYIANDGTVDSDVQYLDIEILGASEAPIAHAVSISTNEDAGIVYGQLIGKDDGLPIIYGLYSLPDYTDEDSLFTYNEFSGEFRYGLRPSDQSLAAGETREFTFTYIVRDAASQESAPATVTITIYGVNDAPVATDIAVMGSEDDAIIYGHVSAADVDGDTLSYAISGASPDGLTLNTDGSFSYIPQEIDQALKAGESREVTFQYVANDGFDSSAAQTVTITVQGVDDLSELGGAFKGLIIEADDFQPTPNAASGTIFVDDIDSPNQGMQAATLDGQYGRFTINQAGEWTYQLNPQLAVIQTLTAQDLLQEEFSVVSQDGVTEIVVIDIKGSDFFRDVFDLNQYLGGRFDDVMYGLSGQDLLDGQEGNDILYGGSDQDVLIGGAGDDYLDGGTNVDSLVGGNGDDIYVVNLVRDAVIELVNEGIDTVYASVSVSLGENVENLVLTATNLTGTGNVLSNTLTAHAGGSRLLGGGGNDTLNGAAGNDVLDGGVGADLMRGDMGNDVYFANVRGDMIVEDTDAGIDTVNSSVNWDLGANLENLNLLGTGNIYAKGNSLDNVLTGNSGNNLLDGKGGADLLIGGAGSDTYQLNRGYGQNTIQEAVGASGTDTVQIGVGVRSNQVWFSRAGDDLQVTIIGTESSVLVEDWYAAGMSVESFRLANGQQLSASNVQSLVDAMAMFDAPSMGMTSLTAQQNAALGDVINSSWMTV